jgi:hypothetical protein
VGIGGKQQAADGIGKGGQSVKDGRPEFRNSRRFLNGVEQRLFTFRHQSKHQTRNSARLVHTTSGEASRVHRTSFEGTVPPV